MKRPIQKMTSLLLCILMLLGTVNLSVFAAGTHQSGGALANYGAPGMENDQALTADRMYQSIYGQAPISSVSEYLSTMRELSFTYNSLVPESTVSTKYFGTEGRLEVTVLPYSYVAENGATVQWIPINAEIEGKTVDLIPSGSAYVCAFEGLYHSSDFDMKVSYRWEVELPADYIERLYDDPYRAGKTAAELLEAHEKASAEYQKEMQKYLAYQGYLQAVEDFNDYCTAMETYAAEMEAYDAYLKKYEQYSKEQAAYEARQAYEEAVKKFYAYQDFLRNDLERYKTYLEYLQDLEKITSKLAALETLFVPDSHGWQLYASLMGGTVSSVLDRKNELVALGCSMTDLNNADKATVALRKLLKNYDELRNVEYASDYERTTALFAYYSTNYQALKTEFAALYGVLYGLYGNAMVVEYMDMQGKREHYQQFVGQLYITASCFDDSHQYSPDWIIGKRGSTNAKTLFQAVEECHRVKDTGASDPTGVTMPTEVPKVEEVEPAEMPSVEPPAVKKPTAPEFMAEPVKPTEVKDPSQSAIPPKADHPGNAPAEPVTDVRLRALAKDFSNGTLTADAPKAVKTKFTFDTQMIHPVSISNKMTVTFYNQDGSAVLYRKTVEYGESVSYQGPSLDRPDTPEYTYRFLKWSQPNGAAVDLHAVTSNLSLYAIYEVKQRSYTVTWVLDDVTRMQNYTYGMLPQCPFRLEKEESDGYTYTFAGWDREVVPVTEDTVYYGSFTSSAKPFTVIFVVNGKQYITTAAYGSVPVFSGDTLRAPDDYVYRFVGWDKTLHTVIENTVYEAVYEKSPLATTLYGTVVNTTHEKNGIVVHATVDTLVISEAISYAAEKGISLTVQNGITGIRFSAEEVKALAETSVKKISLKSSGNTYTVGFLNSASRPVSISPSYSWIGFADEDASETSSYYLQTETGLVKMEENAIAAAGITSLEVRKTYRVNKLHAENCNLLELADFFEAGATVSLKLSCVFGYEITAAEVITESGKTLPVEDLSFVMPNEPVTVSLTVEKAVYRVQFVVDGIVLSTAEYGLGESITLPEAPQKAADELYRYTFMGWDKNVTIAMGEEKDLIFTALFSKTAINVEDPYQTGHDNNRLLTLYLPIFGAVVLAVIALVIFLKWRKKKNLAAAQKENDTANADRPLDTAEPSAAVENAERTDEASDLKESAPDGQNKE